MPSSTRGSSPRLRRLAAACLPFCVLVFASVCSRSAVADDTWVHLSSKTGDLPAPPGGSTQQTGAVVADFDNDGRQDFVLSFRQKPPALVWYRRGPATWDQYVIETDGKNQHHDQVFADVLGTGTPQLAFWNQQARSLFLAEIPADVRAAKTWPATAILTSASSGATPYTEGMSAADVDADGSLDLLACNMWFKHTGGKQFQAIRIGDVGGLISAGRFKPSKSSPMSRTSFERV